jgi:hypothetical protein
MLSEIKKLINSFYLRKVVIRFLVKPSQRVSCRLCSRQTINLINLSRVFQKRVRGAEDINLTNIRPMVLIDII